MQAYEFNSTVDNGKIHIPEQYRDKLPADVKVIVLAHDEQRPVGENSFSAIRLQTKDFRFDRGEANAR